MFIRRLTPGFRALFLVILALALFLPGLGRRDIVTSHEARVAQTARAMMAAGAPWNAQLMTVPAMKLVEINGFKRLRKADDQPPMLVNPWLVPVMSERIRMQKPPLPYWMAAICFQLFDYSEASARLPSALMAAFATAFIFDLGRRLLGKRAGWYAALAWISLYFVFDEHRKAMADPSLAFLTLVALWAWVRAVQSTRRRVLFVLLVYVALALGALSKGPLIFLHVALALAALHWSCRLRFPGRWWQHLLGFAVLLLIALPWPLYVLEHVPRVLEFWRYQPANEEKARSVFFYLPQVFYISLPWTGVWIFECVMAVMRWRHTIAPAAVRRARRNLFPILWLLVVVVAMSASPVKKNAYLLPEAAAIALTVGAGLRRLVIGLRIRSQRPLSRVLMIGTLVVGAGAGLLVWPLHKTSFDPPQLPKDAMSWAGLAAASIALALIFAAVPALALMRRIRQPHWPAAQAIVLAVAISLIINFAVTPRENRRSARPACQEVLALLQQGHRTMATEELAEEVAVYLPLDPETAIPSGSRYAGKVLYLYDDSSSADARRHGENPQPFNPKGKWIDGGEVTEFHRLPIPGSRDDVRWQLWELTVTRTAVVLK